MKRTREGEEAYMLSEQDVVELLTVQVALDGDAPSCLMAALEHATATHSSSLAGYGSIRPASTLLKARKPVDVCFGHL